MAKMGSPTKYKEEFVEQAFRLCLIGLIDEELAKAFSVTVQTLNNWKKKYPEFFASIKKGRLGADGDVAKSLYKRAMGNKETSPDTGACIFWLKNRQPAKWRDKPPEVQDDGDKAKSVSIEFVVEDASKKD